MEITEKVAYLKGLMEGLAIDRSSPEGKLFTAIADVLDEMAFTVSSTECAVSELTEVVDELDESLGEVEELLFGDDDECDCCGDDEYEANCPGCGAQLVIDQTALENGDTVCPECGESIEFTLEEEDGGDAE